MVWNISIIFYFLVHRLNPHKGVKVVIMQLVLGGLYGKVLYLGWKEKIGGEGENYYEKLGVEIKTYVLNLYL